MMTSMTMMEMFSLQTLHDFDFTRTVSSGPPSRTHLAHLNASLLVAKEERSPQPGQPTPSNWSAWCKTVFNPSPWTCTSGVSTCQVPVRRLGTGCQVPASGGRPWNPSWLMAPSNRWWWLTLNVEWPSIRKAQQRHFPGACAWTDWQHQQDSVDRAPAGEPTAEPSRATCLAPSPLSWCWEPHARKASLISRPPILRPRCVDDGQALVRSALFDF